jgi:hypothetical protein
MSSLRTLTLCGMFWLVAQACFAQIAIQDEWTFTLNRPGPKWLENGFDDSKWKKGSGGFGTFGTPGARIGTRWQTNNIWLRKHFEVKDVPANVAILIHHDEEADVFLMVSLSHRRKDSPPSTKSFRSIRINGNF